MKLDEILEVIGDRKFISVDEVKHTTRLGMGPCRGKRCIRRLGSVLRGMGIELVGDATPRGPLSNQVAMGELYPRKSQEIIIPPVPARKIKVKSLVAGGGIGGSALFRYLAEEGLQPVLLNYGRGASWRNIAGGRPNFSVPELSDIARHNLQIFKELQAIKNVDFRPINYVTFAHDNDMYRALEASMQWSNAEMIAPKDFASRIAPGINKNLGDSYMAALITHDCWQATPGRVIDLIRQIGIKNGGTVEEDCELIDLRKEGKKYFALVKNHRKEYIEYETEIFINALGTGRGKICKDGRNSDRNIRC